jgi:hypothetical protein
VNGKIVKTWFGLLDGEQVAKELEDILATLDG